MLQHLYFYFYNEVALKYFWLHHYFKRVKQMRKEKGLEHGEVPFFLTTPQTQVINVRFGGGFDAQKPVLPKQVPVKPSRKRGGCGSADLLHPLRAAPDPSIQIYEKDVILEDTSDVRNAGRGDGYMGSNKRLNTSEPIEREELSEEEL